MLKISKLTDYALLIMSQLAKKPDAVLSAAYLAEALHLSSPTVSKILKMLGEAKLARSVRGVDGGYRLARPARDMTVADIIAAMEGEMAMTECCEVTNLCAINAVCTMRDNWKSINKQVQSLLASYTLDDMLRPLLVEKELSHGK